MNDRKSKSADISIHEYAILQSRLAIKGSAVPSQDLNKNAIVGYAG